MNKKMDTLEISGPLAESMDQSIGEVTTVMGAMISELMRRSLRGGVIKIGEELQSLVVEKVDSAVAQRVPEVERAAVAVAEQTAQIAAAKVAAEEVYALDVKTGETARRLESQIEGVGRETRGAVEAARQAAEQLSGQIVEAEKRVCEVTQAEIDQRLAGVVEKSREAATALKARLKALEDLAEGLTQQLRDERAAHERLKHGIEQGHVKVKDEVSALRKVNEELAARVAALEEKPKGFFSRWFGKRKGKGEADD